MQSRGIGTSVLRRTCEEARRRNVPVRLRVLRRNRAQDLYRRLGFEPEGETETHVLLVWQGKSP